MIRTEKPHLQTAGRTHPGMTGKNNEDYFGIFSYRFSKSDPRPSILAIVADGVGGKQAGEVASRTAVEMIRRGVEQSDGSSPVETLADSYLKASAAIIEKAGQDLAKKGMGTTATSVWVIEDRLYGMNIGNSRLYLMRDKALRQISKDHSWVQEAIDAGAISPDQARNHPNSHVITRYLGGGRTVPDARLWLAEGEPEEAAEKNQGAPLEPGDLLFLCSDGLSDVVEDFEIEAALKNGALDSALDHLIALANARGGPDNITVVALQVPMPGTEASVESQSPGRQRAGIVRLLVYLASSTVLALVLLFWWLFLR